MENYVIRNLREAWKRLIAKTLHTWQRNNNTTNWSGGTPFVYLMKNTVPNAGRMRNPFETYLNTSPRRTEAATSVAGNMVLHARRRGSAGNCGMNNNPLLGR